MGGTEKGKQINAVFLYVSQVFKECQRLIYKIDSEMAPEWNNLYGNRITKNLSADLRNPDFWLIYGIFRYYENEISPLINKGINISLWDDYELEEPIIIAGKINYNDISKRDHWDLWSIWHDWESEDESSSFNIDGKVNYFKSEECEYIKEAYVFSLPLVEISDDETLLEKVIVPLKNL